MMIIGCSVKLTDIKNYQTGDTSQFYRAVDNFDGLRQPSIIDSPSITLREIISLSKKNRRIFSMVSGGLISIFHGHNYTTWYDSCMSDAAVRRTCDWYDECTIAVQLDVLTHCAKISVIQPSYHLYDNSVHSNMG